MTEQPAYRTTTRPPRRLSEQIARAIQDDLISTRRPPGEQLPSEPELAAQYDVSRTVIREAGRLLVERGLVDIRPGRGMVVAQFDGGTIARQYELMLQMERARFDQLIEMRLVLEVGLTEYAAVRRTSEDLDLIDSSLAAFAEPGISHDLALEYDLAFHAAVAAAAHNPFFTSVVNPINDYLRTKYRSSIGYDEAKERTLAEHTAIANAIRDGDATQASSMARLHLIRIMETRNELVEEQAASAAAEGSHA